MSIENLKFKKMHGLGNDFVVLDFRDDPKELNAEQIQYICDRNFGVGCDLLAILETSENADIFLRFYNADGSESAACGNATRCAADIVMKEQEGTQSCTIETGRGVLYCTRAERDMITVDMGVPVNVEIKDSNMIGFEGPITNMADPVCVDMGNPHCVFFVKDLAKVPVEEIGPYVENHAAFPNRTNVEFVEVQSDTKMRQVTWERGVGLTLACGSGACAVAVSGVYSERTGRQVEIELDGGSLFIEYRESDGHVMMTGPVTYVFDGILKDL